jgi:N-acetylglucosaminyl-diphospho-decaprenol L-rhamnosyltransferase
VSKLGVVMVTYRAGDRVAASLGALADARDRLPPEHELLAVIVDNASGDGTVDRVRERAPWADLVALRANRGFAAGCNVGIGRAAHAEVIVLLNPDVEVASDFLARVASLEWPPDVAARGPAILDGRGQVEQSARGFPRARTALLGRTSLLARIRPASPLLREELLADPGAGARPVDWVSGACLIAPAQRFGAVGPLDEGYFMYWEDADWCRRAHAMGYSVVYEPQLTVTHHQGSSSRHRSMAATIAFHRSALRYWRKHMARSPASTALAGAALSMRCAFKLAAVAIGAAAARVRPTRSAR